MKYFYWYFSSHEPKAMKDIQHYYCSHKFQQVCINEVGWSKHLYITASQWTKSMSEKLKQYALILLRWWNQLKTLQHYLFWQFAMANESHLYLLSNDTSGCDANECVEKHEQDCWRRMPPKIWLQPQEGNISLC